ncbi:MAG: DUF4352 domain-containing protein [Actinomycetota bacterium]|nr:DUF4352 domain-containing protein [Actinomycetota bacterium]
MLFLALGALAVLVVGVGALAAMTLGGNPEPRGSAEPQPPPTTQEETTVPEEATEETDRRMAETEDMLVGESVESNGVRVRLNGLRLLPETEIEQPRQTGGMFLATDLTFENTSNEPVAVSSLLEFVLKDEDGYSANQAIHSEQRQLSEGEISPDQRTSGEIVYDVPSDAQQGLQLDYSPLGGETYTWSVGDTGRLSQPTPSAPNDGYQKPSAPKSEPTAPEEEPVNAEIARAVQYYYEAVDREDWAYTYDNLDYETRELFTEDEWYQKNQWFADNQSSELVSVNSDVVLSPSGNEADVTAYRTFSDGTTQERETAFVYEGGLWKHRFIGEEIYLFMPGVPFEDFVAAQ